MAVTIGQDAFGNAIITGDNNQTFVFYGLKELHPELIADIQSGRRRAADIPEAVPLPALTLAIDFEDDTRTQWKIAARRATEVPVERSAAAPWRDDPAFDDTLDIFWRLSRVPTERPEDAARLNAAAHGIGDRLALALTAEETAFLIAAARGDPPPPLVVIESDDDRILALPWELIRLNGRFAVHDGRLDVARSVPGENAPVLSKPAMPMSLLVNISAPEASGLDYERESYAIVRALHEHLGVVVNEMGEVDDLVAGLKRDPPPLGVHFSGHGGPGTLVFEDEYGAAKPVAIPELLAEIRRNTAGRLPRFFFLACCHGGDPVLPASDNKGLPATATALHRDGITQVVGYFGPVLDDLATRAERVFYAELANGRRTRDAVRVARAEMRRAQASIGRSLPRDAGDGSSNGPMAFAWVQMVLYHHGPDYPLGTSIEGAGSVAMETTERRAEAAFPNSRTRVLKAGFVGRRKEMHALRADLRQGRHLHVVQGTGGLGKSAFCTEALKVYDRLGWQPFGVWCIDVEGAPNPVAGLVSQIETAGDALCGDKWPRVLAAYEQAASQDEGRRSSSGHLLFLLQGLLAAQPRKLVLYLDNLESLQTGPRETDGGDFAEWRDCECAGLWKGLLAIQREAPGRLAVLASSRYRHPDFGAVVAFDSLPADALWRMLLWFPNLRRMSEDSRGRLVGRLAGHPRAVEFLDALIEEAIRRWEYERGGPFLPGCLGTEDEQTQLVAQVLPELDARLSENLLFGALWDRVLDASSRELLVRAGVLRRPGDRGLLIALAGDHGEEAVSRLVRTGLLAEIREPRSEGGWSLTYRVLPTLSRLAEQKCESSDDFRREGHQRAGDYLEQVARSSRSWQEDIEAAYHLRQCGQSDRSCDLVAPLVEQLQSRGLIQDSRFFLQEIGDPKSLHPTRAAVIHLLSGSAAESYGDLEEAGAAYRAGLAIRERLAAADPSNSGWQRELSVSQNKVGDVLSAQGRLDDALATYRAGLAIAERLAAADPSNATWQHGLSVSQERVGNVLSAQGRLDDALATYRSGLALRELLATADPINPGWQREVAVSQNKIGEVLSAQGRLDDALSAYRAGLAIAERLATADPSNAGWQRDLSVSQHKVGDVLSAQGRLDDAVAAYRADLAIAERLAAADPSNAGWQHDLSVSQEKVGNVLSAQGRLDDALAAYRSALALREFLATADPTNARWQRDLSVSQNKVGDALSAQGRLDDALTAYYAGLAIRERLAAADPSNAGWQRDLSVSRNNVGNVLSAQGRLDDALSAYRAGLAIGERLAAADPSNAGWQRDLSVSQEKLGDVLSAQGRLDDALGAYRAGLAIRERLAAADPSNAGWQRDLSVSQEKLGDVLSAQGRLDDALGAYRAGLAIRERLAAADPSNAGWQRDLSVSRNKLGDVLSAQGRLDDALSAYRAGLAVAERLAAADPSNAGWQRDLSVSQNKVGDVLWAQGRLDDALSAYRAGLAIAEPLAAADPSNAGWQRDLSVSRNNVGDVLSAQGRLDDALSAYRAGLVIRERLATADPSNAGWQRDLSVSQNKVGDVLSAQGKLDDALAAYRADLAIAERLAAADPSNAGWQRDLFISHEKLGLMEERKHNPKDAVPYYAEAAKIIRRLAPRDPSNAQWQRDLTRIEERLAAVSVASASDDREKSGRWSGLWSWLKR